MRLNVPTLILGCRDAAKGQTAKEQLDAIPSNVTNVEVWNLDMAWFDSVIAFAHRANGLPRLDALAANAGASVIDFRKAEGYELTLAVNVISTFLLALLCLPKPQQTTHQTRAATHPSIVGLQFHVFAKHEHLVHAPTGKVFEWLSRQSEADMGGQFFLSKLIVLLCVQEMAPHVPGAEKGSPRIIVNCPSPGLCKPDLFRENDGGAFNRFLLKAIGKTAEERARNLTAATAAQSDSHDQYLSECQVKPASVWARSEAGQANQKRVWKELHVEAYLSRDRPRLQK